MKSVLRVYGTPCGKRSGHDAAHALLSYACRHTLGTPMPPLTYTRLGKPCLPTGAPAISIAHTRTLAVCALSDTPVGVDAETVRPLRPGVAEKTLNTSELAWLAAQAIPEDAFFSLWTAKEAWSKLLGTGLQGRPRALDLREAVKTLCFQKQIWEHAVVTVCSPHGQTASWFFRTELPDI